MRYVVAALILIAACNRSEPAPAPAAPAPAAESDDVRAIKAVVRGYSATPSTIQFFNVAVRETRPGGWILALAEYDEQNQFGALIRNRNFVVAHRTGTKVQWNKQYAVQNLHGEDPDPTMLATLKALNDWPMESK